MSKLCLQLGGTKLNVTILLYFFATKSKDTDRMSPTVQAPEAISIRTMLTLMVIILNLMRHYLLNLSVLAGFNGF